MKKYLLIEETAIGLTILSQWDTLDEAVRNRDFNTGRHESDRKIYILKNLTWKTTYEEVIN